jgi:pyruvate/2-oxoglutarate dehydrogenase complex dihydrolipoamide dehydrogenase (E3) component
VSTNARFGVETWLHGTKECTVLRGHAKFDGPDVVRVGERLLTAPRIFINVGGRAIIPESTRGCGLEPSPSAATTTAMPPTDPASAAASPPRTPRRMSPLRLRSEV